MKKIAFILLVLFTAGCLFGGEEGPSTIYVTPCNVIGKGIMFRANGSQLNSEIVSQPLAKVLVDDITSSKASMLKSLYGVSCYWGFNVGERKDYYYCNGSYVAPDVDEQGVIVRNLRKEFKIGFTVEEYKGEEWTDMSGKLHKEDSYYDLTVSSVETKCTVYYG